MSDDALPELPKFPPHEKVCGNCKLWQPSGTDHRGWVGPCRVQPQRGWFPPSAPICDAFAPRGVVIAAKPQEPARRERALKDIAPVLVRRSSEGTIGGRLEAPPRPVANANEVVDLGGELNMTRQELMDLFREASGDAPAPPLAAKWEGGVIQLVPGKGDVQGKELPIDSFFHKIVMVRDRLRTLEQKVNAHPKLSDAEKVEMQSYITRIYGSLTTFNVLFRDKPDQFVGAKGDE